MKIVSIHQPHFMPWAGYLDKIQRSDYFVFLDTVQFKKNEFQNRNKIRTIQGTLWLTVPVIYRYPMKIYEVRIENSRGWKEKHIKSIIQNYRKAPFFEKYIRSFEEFYSMNYEFLYDINIKSVRLLCKLMGIDTKTILASEIKGIPDEPTERLVGLCKYLGADVYLSGKDGIKYINLELFNKAGITVNFQDFHHPVYHQVYSGFVPFLSAIDLLFNCGEKSLEIIKEFNP